MKEQKYQYISVIHSEEKNNKNQKISFRLGHTKEKLQRTLSVGYEDVFVRCLENIKLPKKMREDEVDKWMRENMKQEDYTIKSLKEKIDKHKQKYWRL